ncbi:zinc finger associated protein [Popillia japonica]|uniref:Zinc finger associated protein n=1 Tax=Popillia japonica TaxID=7064 RepID=A0AAW1JXX1_POPJA
MATKPEKVTVREDTPTPYGSGPSSNSESLTDEEILAQIKYLHSLLKKRRQNGSKRLLSANSSSDEERPSSGLSPLNMDTSFCSTSSLVRTMAPSAARKRKGSSSPPSTPSRRIKVTALVHSPSGNQKISTDGCQPSCQKTDTPKPDLRPNDDINNIEVFSLSERTQPANNTRSRRFPPLRSRPQRPQLSTTVSAQAAEKTRINPGGPELARRSSAEASPSPKRRTSSEADYRTLTKFFSDDQIPYHTYQLPSEKLLNVVLRGVPVEIEEKAIYDDLRERGFEPDSVIRMRRTRDEAPMPLVLVKISKEQKAIYHLDEVVPLEVSVETLKSRPTIGQCHRCQKFGHAQSRCTATRKCVACAKNLGTPNLDARRRGNAWPVLENTSLAPANAPNRYQRPARIVKKNTRLTTAVVHDFLSPPLGRPDQLTARQIPLGLDLGRRLVSRNFLSPPLGRPDQLTARQIPLGLDLGRRLVSRKLALVGALPRLEWRTVVVHINWP